MELWYTHKRGLQKTMPWVLTKFMSVIDFDLKTHHTKFCNPQKNAGFRHFYSLIVVRT